MSEKLVLPQLGESVAEADIIEWRVAVGDRVEAGAPIAEVSTEKVDMEIESPFTGTITAIHAEPGSTVDVGEMIAEIAVEA